MFPAFADFHPLDLAHILIVGQSNALNRGSASPPQRYKNRMFKGGTIAGTLGYPVNYTEILPLVEPAGESIATGFTDFLGYKSNGGYPCLITNNSVGATAYSGLAKGTAPYAVGIRHIREARQRLGNRVTVPAIVSVHGENDAASATYGTDMRQWQLDYETDINNLMKSTARIPMFHTQSPYPGFATNTGVIALLAEHVANPTKTILVGPRYFLNYSIDGVHLDGPSARRLGEYHGKAFWRHVVLGQQWEPLRPSNVVRTGASITITFTGNVGQLVLDTLNVINPGNYGFDFIDDSASATVTGVAIQGTNQVVITLSGTPTGANKKIRYGYNGATEAGAVTGKRGNLHDSDPEGSPNRNSLVNWCVYFNEAAT